MKYIFLSLLFTCSAFADEMPAGLVLERQGYFNCQAGTVYNNRRTCGELYARLFKCQKNDKGNMIDVEVLAIGEIESDVHDVCSPTVVLRKFIEAK